MKANLYYGSTCKEKEQQKEVRSPYDGRVVSSFCICDAMDAKEILEIAQKAVLHVKLTSVHQRMNWLLDVAQKLESERERIALCITDEVGKPITFSRVEVDRCIETIKLSANAILHVNGETFDTTAMPSGKKSLAFYKREPVGVVLAITPFNFPLNLVAHKIAPALVAGNAVILKPTSQAPRTAYELVKLFIESPYAPKDALSLIYSGEGVNEALITSDIPRVINSGQVCISLQRIYVHNAIYDSFAKALVEETKNLHVGSPYDEKTFIGPMVNEAAVDKAKGWIQSAINEGAKPLCGFTCKDLLFEPTIMANVTEQMQIVCEEVFAPIVSLIKVSDYEDAKEKMNASMYGLQYSVFCNDLSIAHRAIDELEAGGIVINDIPTLRFDLQPYGGIKQSGIGKEGPYFALMDDYTQIKSVVIC